MQEANLRLICRN